MRTELVRFGVLCGVVLLCGCRFKGIESFETATTPVKFEKASGDRYSNGGIAYASAGSHVATRYGLGSNPNSAEKVDAKLDKPAYGTGQEAGEEGGESAAGYGKSNSPANQPQPSVDSATSH